MILALIEIGAIASLAVYLGYWRAGVRRRRAQAWDRLVVQLQPNWIARELGNQSSWNEEQDATPEEIWRRVQGANGLWAMLSLIHISEPTRQAEISYAVF